MITARCSSQNTHRQFRGPARQDERTDLRLIALAVLWQAAEDLVSSGPLCREEARQFLDDPDFETWCDIAGLAPARTRRALLEASQ